MDNVSSTNPVEPVLNGTVSHGTCESCPNTDVKITKCGSIWMCDVCYQKDIDAALAYQTPELQEERLAKHKEKELLEQIQKENSQLRISPDIFNAKIKSITDLKREIDDDLTIENKNNTLAQVLSERFSHLNNLLNDLVEKETEYKSEQRAIQTFYVGFRHQLRQEEREKLKLEDANYKPVVIAAKPKKEAPKKKWDKTGVMAAAARSGIQEHLIQLTCQGRDVTPEQAVEILKAAGVKGK